MRLSVKSRVEQLRDTVDSEYDPLGYGYDHSDTYGNTSPPIIGDGQLEYYTQTDTYDGSTFTR